MTFALRDASRTVALGALLSGVSAVCAWSIVVLHPLAPVALLLGGMGLTWLLRSPFHLLLAFLAVLFTRPADFVPALAVLQPAKMLALAALGGAFADRLLRRKIDIPWSPLHAPAFALVVAFLLSATRGTSPSDSLGLFSEVIVKIIMLYLLIFGLIDRPARAHQFMWTLAALDAALGGYALGAKLTGNATIEGSRAGLVGLLGDPNDLAFTLLMSTPFLIAMAWKGEGKPRAWARFLLLFVLGGVLSTQSRGGLLGLAMGSFILMREFIRSKLVIAAILGMGLMGGAVAAGLSSRQSGAVSAETDGVDESAQGRLDAWKAGGRMLARNPILGVGPGQFAVQYEHYASDSVFWGLHETHNAYIKCAAEAGFAGLLPFLLLIIRSVQVNMQARLEGWKREGNDRILLIAQQPGLAAILTSAFFLSQTWSWFLYIQVISGPAILLSFSRDRDISAK